MQTGTEQKLTDIFARCFLFQVPKALGKPSICHTCGLLVLCLSPKGLLLLPYGSGWY